MDFNLIVFQEPRGVMRIFHLIFAICAFATISGYSGSMKFACNGETATDHFNYPFEIVYQTNISYVDKQNTNITCNIEVIGDFSSDAKFFVTTGVLAMLFSLATIYIYTKLDELYKSNTKLPLYDFLVTVIFGVLWLSSSAAWANGLTGLKYTTYPTLDDLKCKDCQITTSNFSTLNISVIFGFLNFFLWAADLWFIYKETSWFQANHMQSTEGV